MVEPGEEICPDSKVDMDPSSNLKDLQYNYEAHPKHPLILAKLYSPGLTKAVIKWPITKIKVLYLPPIFKHFCPVSKLLNFKSDNW